MCKICGGKETCPGSKSTSGKWEKRKSEKKSDTARILPGIHVLVHCNQSDGDEGNAAGDGGAGDGDATGTLRAGIVAIAYKDKTFDVLFDDEGYALRVSESRVRLHEQSIEYVNYSKGIVMDRKAVASIARDQLAYLKIIDEVGEDTLYVPFTSSNTDAPRSEHSARSSSSRLSPGSRSQSVDDECSEDIWEDVKSEAELLSSSNDDAAADITKRLRRRRSHRMNQRANSSSSSRRYERRRSTRVDGEFRVDGSEPEERSREVDDNGDDDKIDDQGSKDSDDYSGDDREEEGQKGEDREESSDSGDDGMDSDDDDYAEHDSDDDDDEEEEEEEEEHRGRSRESESEASNIKKKDHHANDDDADRATVNENDEIEEEDDVKLNLEFGHGGIMKCACGMQMGDLYFPLHVAFRHCDKRCRWSCCGGMWNDSLCSNPGESAALIEEREAKKQAEAKAAKDSEKPYDLLTPKELVEYLIHQVPDDGSIKSD